MHIKKLFLSTARLRTTIQASRVVPISLLACDWCSGVKIIWWFLLNGTRHKTYFIYFAKWSNPWTGLLGEIGQIIKRTTLSRVVRGIVVVYIGCCLVIIFWFLCFYLQLVWQVLDLDKKPFPRSRRHDLQQSWLHLDTGMDTLSGIFKVIKLIKQLCRNGSLVKCRSRGLSIWK